MTCVDKGFHASTSTAFQRVATAEAGPMLETCTELRALLKTIQFSSAGRAKALFNLKKNDNSGKRK